MEAIKVTWKVPFYDQIAKLYVRFMVVERIKEFVDGLTNLPVELGEIGEADEEVAEVRVLFGGCRTAEFLDLVEILHYQLDDLVESLLVICNQSQPMQVHVDALDWENQDVGELKIFVSGL